MCVHVFFNYHETLLKPQLGAHIAGLQVKENQHFIVCCLILYSCVSVIC